MSINATFDGATQELVVTWKLPADAKLQAYDQIYVNESGKPEYAMVMSDSTKSGLASDSVRIPVKGRLKEGVQYYCRYMFYDGKEYVSHAKSEDFSVSGIKERTDSNVCTLTTSLEKVKEDGADQVAITVKWNMPASLKGTISTSDYIRVMKTGPGDGWSRNATFGFGSGEVTGEIKLYLLGYCEPGIEYVVSYVENGSSPEVSLGYSAPFTVDGYCTKLADAEKTAAQGIAQKFNTNSIYRHQMTAAKAKMGAEYNPLLTITPQPSLFAKLLAEREGTQESKKKAAAAASENEDTAAKRVVKGDEYIEEDDFEAQIMENLNSNEKLFIYAGAGVSMDAPSSSPSWWKLMNELLQATFAATPKEHAKLASKLSSSDVSRQPEEIMESFYFVIQERLFTLFQLLEAGRPNANHIAMARLAKAGKLSGILTTNFDIFIERALKAEGIPFKVIVTNEEYKTYYESGCRDFAVMKIHGTIDRPDTIVAVANHYKMGKGFGGYKATVLAHFLQRCPTFFMGYSGWDFEHANYQAFWASVGEVPGKNVYWLTLKGFGGGPNLTKILGSHIGNRLRIGASKLPDFGARLLRNFSPSGADELLKTHASLDVAAINKDIYKRFFKKKTKKKQEKTKKNFFVCFLVEKRLQFLKEWVGKLPPAPLLTLITLEAQRLNQKNQERMKRMKEHNAQGNAQSAQADTNAMMAFYTQLGADMAAGKITMEEYQDQIQVASMETTFAYCQIPKEELKKVKLMVVKEGKSNPMFTTGTDAATMKAFLPSIVLSAAETEKNAEKIMEMSLKFVKERLVAYVDKTDLRSKFTKQAYQYSTTMLRASPEDIPDIEALINNAVEEGIQKNLDETGFTTFFTQNAMKLVNNLVFGTLDVNPIVESQLRYALNEKTDDLFLESAMAIALGLQRQAVYRGIEVMQMQSFISKVSTPIGMSADRDIASSTFLEIEAEIEGKLSSTYKTLFERLKKTKPHSNGKLNKEEVLAAFDVANTDFWFNALKYTGTGYQTEQQREQKGFYPRENLHKSVVAFLKPRIESAEKVVKDERLVQPILGIMAMLGESVGDLEYIKTASEKSLKLTQGKVTELTPYPIPEALAAAYEEKGDYQNAVEWYEKALDGIKTSVIRQKTDAIVLNACLVQAQFSKEKALIWAFKYSPHFSTVQQWVQVGAGRSLLIQQAQEWCTELGYQSLEQAEAKLVSKED